MTTTTAVLSQYLADGIDGLMATDPAYSATRCTWSWVRTEGTVFTDQVPVPDHQRGPVGHCFEYSQILAYAYPSLTYCEGYSCLENGARMEHAWNITPEGKVLDATWPGGGTRLPRHSVRHHVDPQGPRQQQLLLGHLRRLGPRVRVPRLRTS